MARRAKDPVAIAKQLLEALGQGAPEAANDDGRQVDDETIREWARGAAERARRARKQ